MIVEQIVEHKAQSASIIDYAASLMRAGTQVLPGTPGTFWARHESSALARFPRFYLTPPSSNEIRQVLWHGRAAIASYLLEPDEHHLANAWLYICTDHTYALEKLSRGVRYNVRLGLRELTIAPLTSEQLLTHGVQAYCDTRRRNGLSDGTSQEFQRWFADLARMPEVVYLGAWKDNQLAAFLYITEVDDWAEISCFSMDALLRYKPNDALIYSILSHYLVERKLRLVSFGLSSIQAESNITGLHRFKTQLGFEARPVHRAFVPHPLLRIFTTRLTLWTLNTALRFKPGNRHLKKARGVLAYMLGDQGLVEATTGSADNE